jgi:hemoglobin/transferrin/lactoferrin receptor protein
VAFVLSARVLFTAGLGLACASSIQAQPPGSRVLVVVDGASGLPVATARVTVGAYGPTTRADAAGQVVLHEAFDAGLERPGCLVHVSAVGYGDAMLACHLLGALPATVTLVPDTLQLSERVVVSARLDRADPVPLPRATAVVDAAEITRRQSRTTPEALDEMPGVFVQKTNHGAGSPIVRGLMGNQVLVLVDGIRLNNATFRYGPNQYLATVDVFGVDRLEVVRGPGSVEFGSDAMGGVINVLTKAPTLSAVGAQTTGSATARIVSDGMEQSGRGEAEYASPRVAVRGGVSVRRFGDLHSGGDLGVLAPSGYDELAGDARLVWQASPATTVSAAWQLLHQDDVPRFDQVRQRGFRRWSFAPQARQLAWGRVSRALPVAWMSSVSVTGSWQGSFERRERQARGSAIFVTEEDRIRSTGVLAEATARPVGGLAIRYGLDLYHDDVSSTRADRNLESAVVSRRRGLYPDGATARSAEIFAVGAWTKGRATVDGGVRQTWGRVAAADAVFGDVDLETSATTGSLGAGVTLDGGFEVYGTAAQAFRAPNIDDTSTLGAFDFGVEVPAADLVPERSLSLEAGVRLRRQRLAMAAAVWRTSLSDLIDRVRSTYLGLETWEGQRVYRRANVGDARLTGFEVEGRASVGGPFEVGGFIAYAFGEQQPSGQPLRRVPPLNGQLALRWRHRRADAEASWRAAAEQDRLASGDRDDHRIAPGGTPEWHVVDLRGGFAFTPTLQVLARFGNVLDRAYRIHGSGIDGMGRHLSMSLRVGPR